MLKTLKSQIFLLLLFFLMMFCMIGLLGYLYLQSFADKSRSIMEDNYLTIRNAQEMQELLNYIHEYHLRSILYNHDQKDKTFQSDLGYEKSILSFEAQLITIRTSASRDDEPWLLDSIQNTYRAYISSFRKAYNQSVIDQNSNKVDLINEWVIPTFDLLKDLIARVHSFHMEAILQKSKTVQSTGAWVSFYLSVMVLISILSTILLLFTLPSYLSQPYLELNQRIQEMIKEKYDQKLEWKIHKFEELKELTFYFNLLSKKLKNYQNSIFSPLLHEQKRTEAIIQIFKKAVLILDQDLKFVHINEEATDLIGLDNQIFRGKHISKVARQSENLQLISNLLILSEAGVGDTYPTEFQEDHLCLWQNGIELPYRCETREIFSDHQMPGKVRLIGYMMFLEPA